MSIFLSFILLAGSVQITLGTHYCGGTAVAAELMLGHQHLDCGMTGMDKKQPESHGNAFSSQCCDNEYQTLATDETMKQSAIKKMVNAPIVLALPPVYQFTAPALSQQMAVPYYRPPTFVKDINILHQVFLI